MFKVKLFFSVKSSQGMTDWIKDKDVCCGRLGSARVDNKITVQRKEKINTYILDSVLSPAFSLYSKRSGGVFLVKYDGRTRREIESSTRDGTVRHAGFSPFFPMKGTKTMFVVRISRGPYATHDSPSQHAFFCCRHTPFLRGAAQSHSVQDTVVMMRIIICYRAFCGQNPKLFVRSFSIAHVYNTKHRHHLLSREFSKMIDLAWMSRRKRAAREPNNLSRGGRGRRVSHISDDEESAIASHDGTILHGVLI